MKRDKVAVACAIRAGNSRVINHVCRPCSDANVNFALFTSVCRRHVRSVVYYELCTSRLVTHVRAWVSGLLEISISRWRYSLLNLVLATKYLDLYDYDYNYVCMYNRAVPLEKQWARPAITGRRRRRRRRRRGRGRRTGKQEKGK